MQTSNLNMTKNSKQMKFETDGRTKRARDRRNSVLEALLSLYRQGKFDPSIKEVMEHSGVSRRTIHYLFTDIETLAKELQEYLRPKYEELHRFEAVSGSLEDRTRTMLQHHARLFETISPTRRAAMTKVHRIKTIARSQRMYGMILREQAIQLYKDELPDAPEQLIEILDMLTSWETWERLRQRQKLSIKKTCDILTHMILAQIRYAQNSD
ncbi:MAG: TetR/AcrR family transcriptional regulator [Proteobacteria bacterium]|nr:TetR/AcrR family transcriptional regulator [Pseudomonadota bacterium]